MKKSIMKIISLVLVLAMSLALSVPAFAATKNSNEKISVGNSIENNIIVDINKSMSVSQKDFLKKYVKILNRLSIADDKSLAVDCSNIELKERYSFTDYDIQTLNMIIEKSSSLNKAADQALSGQIKPSIFFQGTVIYFTASDVDALLFAAACAGPTAMVAALDAVAALTGGPVAAVVTTILGVIGVASLSNFCYLCIQAHAFGKGVYIGVEFNGVFPNGVQGLW